MIPFPYVIHGRDFKSTSLDDSRRGGYFRVEPGWLRDGESNASADKVIEFVHCLIEAARKEVNEIHGVVFPESALLDDDCEEIASGVARSHPALQIFVSGTVATPTGATGAQDPRNSAFTALFDNGVLLRRWRQGKHHRWRLEKDQIRRYHLGHVLDPLGEWWEQTSLWPRQCTFSVVRRRASLAVLVCEDLARFDPVLPAINAIGPNLVVALLMDGPQWERRWPGRYASVLADDPGSSVLTLTCLGMIRRSWMPGENQRQTVALWKEPDSGAKELDLPPGDHALLVSLTMSPEEQVSLDRRSDGRKTVRFRLGAARGVRLDRYREHDWPELP